MNNEILDNFEKQVEEPLEFFKDFFFKDQAEYLLELLDQENIPYEISKSETIIDEAIVGNTLSPKIILKLQPKHFERANELIKANVVVDEAAMKDHFLNQLDDKELLEILEKPEEWSIENGVVAKQLLARRGVKYNEAEMKKKQANRLEELRSGKNSKEGSVGFYNGSILAAFLFLSPLFFIAGVGMGFYYWKDSAVDSTGTKFLSYNERTRGIGKMMVFGWVGLFILYFLLLPYVIS